jgi:phosphoenolpyruvate carboxykinase (ATP)
VLTGDALRAQLAERIRWNLLIPELVEAALQGGEGLLTEDGALCVRTGKFTGRSPADKFTVRRPESEAQIDWSSRFNQPLAPERADALAERMLDYAAGLPRLYGFRGLVGRGPHRVPVALVTEYAWHSLMARQMFVAGEEWESGRVGEWENGRVGDPAQSSHSPIPPLSHSPTLPFTLLYTPGFHAEPGRDGTRSEAVIVCDLERRLGLIAGTQYGGEEKKFFFYLMNYLMPLQGVFPMHCAANVGPRGDVSLLFGLSGTGKTTLSADPERRLLGDDEHGWSPEGVFNFEGGCYAKLINLSAEREPVIWNAVNRFGSLMENVALEGRRPDFHEGSVENTRGVYSLEAVPNREPSAMAGHPRTVVYLTYDASGTLPPIALLDEKQALYWFLAGYTAKVAGTERGLGSKPEPTFSACFGAPFLPFHPARYVELMRDYLARHRPLVVLMNTGMVGGAHGEGGHRPAIDDSRRMLRAAQSGELAAVPTAVHPEFGIRVPLACPGVAPEVLDPRRAWRAGEATYVQAARNLAAAFEQQVTRKYAGTVPADVLDAGPRG